MDSFEAISSSNDGDRLKFWASSIPVILDVLGKTSIASRFVEVRECAQGEIVSHKVVPPVVHIEEDGEKISMCAKGDRFFPPFYWNTSMVKVGLAEVASRQFDIAARSTDKVISALSKAENVRFKALLDASVELTNNIIKFGFWYNVRAVFTPGGFFGLLGKMLQKVAKKNNLKYLLCTRSTYTAFCTYVYRKGSSAALEDLNNKKFYGMECIVLDASEENSMFEGQIFLLPEEKIGYRDIRVPLTVLPADTFVYGNFQYGALFGIMEALSITKTDGVCKLIL